MTLRTPDYYGYARARTRTRKAKAPRVLSSRATGRDVVSLWLPGLILPSLANIHAHWRKTANIKLDQRHTVAAAMLAIGRWPRPPVAVLMERIYGKGCRDFDSDNLAICAKAARDEVAAQYGLNDNDPRLAFDVVQGRENVAGLRIILVPVCAGTRREMIDEAVAYIRAPY